MKILYVLVTCTFAIWMKSASSSLLHVNTDYNTLNMDEDTIHITHANGHVDIDWGLTLPEGAEGVNCTEGDYCLDFDVAKVVITQEEHCHKVSWTANSNLTELKDCVVFDGHWYGGGEQTSHPWPLETAPQFESPFAIGHGFLQCVAEAYWVSSQGAAVRVEEGTPLFVSLPDKDFDFVADHLCLSASQEYPFSAPEGTPLTLNYFVCTANDVKEVHLLTYPKFFSNPSGIPDRRMMQDPIWSTWAEYHKDINETTVRDFAKNIKDRGFNYSQVEIDDNWETCYGDLIFDPDKFPDPKQMVDDLHSDDFRVTLWTHPFINEECDSFDYADEMGYFVTNSEGETEMTSWWNGEAGIIDFTNEDAVIWWSQRLEDIRDTMGFDNFKFDSGESSFLPDNFTLNAPQQLWPDVFTAKYADTVTKFGEMAELKVGVGTQTYPNLLRMEDRASIWEGGAFDGLRSLIPSLLNFGLIGYPYALPDMIGGNAYDGIMRPSAELFVRWAQANAFMPGLQFSIAPWEYDDEVIERCKEVTSLHVEMMPLIVELAESSMDTGMPIMRPTWWLCPELESCLTANQQFLVGDDLLVTPVVHKEATTLEVVLPPGEWRRADTGDLYVGPDIILLHKNITIESIVYFKREFW